MLGVVVLDDRRQNAAVPQNSLLKTAAASIGSAKRDRIRRAREEAELMVLLERESCF